MKNDQYFPLEVNMVNDDRVAKVIEKYGIAGYGTYVALLIELRKHNRYKCEKVSLQMLSRLFQIDGEMLEYIIEDSGLFWKRELVRSTQYSSPYLTRVMKRLEEYRKKQAFGGLKRVENVMRNGKGQFTSDAGTVKKSKEEQSTEEQSIITTSSSVADPEISSRRRVSDEKIMPGNSLPTPSVSTPWEEYVHEAFTDESWVRATATKSGMDQYFFSHRPKMIEAFVTHIESQGSGMRINTLQAAKSYMSNFFNEGTVTQQRTLKELQAAEEKQQNSSIHRFETLDPVTGERSYYGVRIPPHAPPRPNDHAIWNDELQLWHK
ncbi:MAG: DUF4373 domain-containing protein [Bacteroides sp.]|nr:DUF4373 domain-containing protein [Bacteroides sp.]